MCVVRSANISESDGPVRNRNGVLETLTPGTPRRVRRGVVHDDRAGLSRERKFQKRLVEVLVENTP